MLFFTWYQYVIPLHKVHTSLSPEARICSWLTSPECIIMYVRTSHNLMFFCYTPVPLISQCDILFQSQRPIQTWPALLSLLCIGIIHFLILCLHRKLSTRSCQPTCINRPIGPKFFFYFLLFFTGTLFWLYNDTNIKSNLRLMKDNHLCIDTTAQCWVDLPSLPACKWRNQVRTTEISGILFLNFSIFRH